MPPPNQFSSPKSVIAQPPCQEGEFDGPPQLSLLAENQIKWPKEEYKIDASKPLSLEDFIAELPDTIRKTHNETSSSGDSIDPQPVVASAVAEPGWELLTPEDRTYGSPELMYPVNRLASFATKPTIGVFQQIKQVYQAMSGELHRPIFYKRNIDIDSTSLLVQEVSVNEHRSLELTNGLGIFADASERKSQWDNKAIACTVIMYGGVAVHWKASTIPPLTCSTDGELRTYYMAAKVNTYFRPLQNFIGAKITTPTPIYEDSQPTINVVKTENPSNKIKHIACWASFSHEEYVNERSEPIYCTTKLQLADIGTKNVPRPQRRILHHFIIGHRFYPKEGSRHYNLLKLATFLDSYQAASNDAPT